MPDTNVILAKIKEMSTRSVNPRPVLTITALTQELAFPREFVQASLAELRKFGLISFCGAASLKLTLLGKTVIQ